MTKQQITNVIGAGTLAALVLIIGLVFGSNGQSSSAEPIVPNTSIVTVTDAPSALESENAQLKETIAILQDREAQFVEQINIANEQLATGYGAGEGEYEEDEYEDDEDGEEHGEYEEEEDEYKHDEEYDSEHDEEYEEDEDEDDDEYEDD